MNESEKIEQLQQRIDALASDIRTSSQQLHSLQKEVERLKSGYPALHVKPITAVPEESVNSAVGGIEQFIGLRLMHLIGIVVLVSGLAIGVKYAIDRKLISEGLRIALAYGAGALLFVFSLRLKSRFQIFSAILFSGSMASVYFTTYAACVYYQFIPTLPAFAIMIVLTVYISLMALRYDRIEIAIVGMIGAYGIPFLLSSNPDRSFLFFSYILLINAGVAFLAIRRDWKLMSKLAMWISWLIFTGWALFQYDREDWVVASGFLLLHYLFCVFIFLRPTILKRKVTRARDAVHVIGLNLASWLAASIVYNPNGLLKNLPAVTAIHFLVVVSLMAMIYLQNSRNKKLLQMLGWQALVFLTGFIALQWDGMMVTLLWLAISVMLFAGGVRLKNAWLRLASVVLMGLTLLKLLSVDSGRFTTLQRIASFIIIGVLLLLFSFYYQSIRARVKQEDRK